MPRRSAHDPSPPDPSHPDPAALVPAAGPVSGRLHVSIADGPSAARRFVRSALPRWTGPTTVSDAELLVSELVTNAIRHAGAEVVAVGVVSTPGSVQIGVHDRVDAPPVASTGRSEPGGYGVNIVDRLADRWGVLTDRSGKTVWFELDAGPTHTSSRERRSRRILRRHLDT